MASFGKVLDLLDERYLELVHDVVGNVEPMPTLVPYHEYTADVLVLRMETNDKLFTALIHDFTERVARETRKEIWTWCAQWDVDTGEASQSGVPAPSLKKPRTDTNEAKIATPVQEETQLREPIIDFEQRVISADLMKEEDTLRILIDIVTIESTLVPNYIEFLYRWIDYYEGDGTALKAAMKCEIPSLWDFDRHPVILPEHLRKQHKMEASRLSMDRIAMHGEEQPGPTANNSRVQQLIQDSPTKKMREKPDLAALERQTEESERLQYREVRYGVQPPNLPHPVAPLLNIPRDPAQRAKYYAACFKSRQRALVHLMEADLTMQQISHYRRGQKEHPYDTPEDPEDNNPKDYKGLRHYYKDAEAAQGIHSLREKMQLQREKQNEIAISSKLAVEARLAAATGIHDGASGAALIPPTPAYTRPPDMAADMLSRIKAAKFEGEERINFVPGPLVGRLKSKLFEGARELTQRLPESSVPSPQPEPVLASNSNDDMDVDNDAAHDTEYQDSQQSEDADGSETDDIDSDEDAEDDDDVREESPIPFSLQPTSAHHPNLINTMGVQHQVSANATMAVSQIYPPSMNQMQPLQAGEGAQFRPMNGNLSNGPPLVLGQPRSASLPGLPPPPIRPPTFAMRPPTYPGSPFPGANMQLTGQRSASLPSPTTPPASSYHHTPTNYAQPQGPSYSPSYQSGLNMPSNFASQQGGLRTFVSGPLPASHFPPLPGAPNLVAPAHPLHSPNGPFGSYGMTSQLPSMGAMLPPPASNPFAGHFPVLPPQQTALASHAPLTPEEEEIKEYMSRPFVLQPLQRPAPPAITITPSPMRNVSHQIERPPPPPSGPMLSPPRPGIQRNAPAPLNIPISPTSPSPFTSLAASLLATTPFAPKPNLINIHIYLPRVIIPGNGVGPGGQRLGNGGIVETDALMIGHTQPGTGKITLTKALFMPVGIWANMLNRVNKQQASMLETYSPHPEHPGFKGKGPLGKGTNGKGVCHAAIYSKLQAAYNLMRTSSARAREQDLTKRWRASKGPMTQRDRGAVWEGYGVTLDKGIEMSKTDREGAYVWSWIVDEGVDKKVNLTEEEREYEERLRALEELEREEEEEGVDLDEIYGLN